MQQLCRGNCVALVCKFNSALLTRTHCSSHPRNQELPQKLYAQEGMTAFDTSSMPAATAVVYNNFPRSPTSSPMFIMKYCQIENPYVQDGTRITGDCNTLQHTATHCNTLLHTATYCNTMQHTATHCNALQHTAKHCNALQRTATHCNCNTAQLRHTATHCTTLHHTEPHCNTLQCTMTCCNTLQLQHTAEHCNVNILQHTTTRCNTLQHTATPCNSSYDLEVCTSHGIGRDASIRDTAHSHVYEICMSQKKYPFVS